MKITLSKKTQLAGSILLLTTAPIHAGDQLVNLGGAIYQDLNLSLNKNQACATCHQQSAGFADPENRVSPHTLPVSDGSDPTLFGGRNAPTAAYAGFSPVFHFDGELFIGGMFWDGRATGRTDVTATGGLGAGPTGDPLADQAKGPFLNPVEMALSSEADVIAIIQASDYADKFEKVFGPNAFADVGLAYNNMSMAIAAFERSEKITQFKSKFDKFVAEQGGDISTFGVEVQADGFRKYVGPPADFKSKVYKYDEADGLAIFNADSYTQNELEPVAPNGAQCYLCHLTENHIDEFGVIHNPILTDFSYDNLGIPVNPRIAELAGPQKIDYGLGGQIAQLEAACPACALDKAFIADGLGDTVEVAMSEAGKFKVSSLRNLPRTAPYGHNGFFPTILEIVQFYNNRDAMGLTPEVSANVNDAELGNLGLTPEQEMKLVLFMETLED